MSIASRIPWITATTIGCQLMLAVPFVRGDDAPQITRYLRPAAGKFVPECEFHVARTARGWSITSKTDRGSAKLEIESVYDRGDRLLSARVTQTGAQSRTATVTVADGKATVQRPGQPPTTFDVPPGVIVTSAPDWTDIFMLCRRYDRQRKGRQEFPGLWVHPVQPPQRLTFTIEQRGTDVIEHERQRVELYRHEIRIRDNSGYLAWADGDGRLVHLTTLAGTGGVLTLAGFESSAGGLRPRK